MCVCGMDYVTILCDVSGNVYCMDICAWNLDSLSVSDDEPTTGTGEKGNVHARSRHNDQNELQRKKERK